VLLLLLLPLLIYSATATIPQNVFIQTHSKFLTTEQRFLPFSAAVHITQKI